MLVFRSNSSQLEAEAGSRLSCSAAARGGLRAVHHVFLAGLANKRVCSPATADMGVSENRGP